MAVDQCGTELPRNINTIEHSPQFDWKNSKPSTHASYILQRQYSRPLLHSFAIFSISTTHLFQNGPPHSDFLGPYVNKFPPVFRDTSQLTLQSVGVSALAATTPHRRDINVGAEHEMLARAVPEMVLFGRQERPQESPEIQRLKDEMKAVSPELESAKEELKQAADSVPQDAKDRIKAAQTKLQDTFRNLPQDKKDELKTKGRAIQEARQAARTSAAPAAPAPTPTA